MPCSAAASLILVTLTPALPPAKPRPLEFQITFSPAVSVQPFTGRVYVMLTAGGPSQLPRGLRWFNPEPVFARDVTGWKPGEPLTVGRDALAYPTPLEKLRRGSYSVFAVMDFDRGGRNFATAEGNG